MLRLINLLDVSSLHYCVVITTEHMLCLFQMAAVEGGPAFRTAETSPSGEGQSDQYLIRRDTTNDHPLKDVDADDFEVLAKYAMMPKGVALAAFSRPSCDGIKSSQISDGLDSRKREDSTLSLESLDLELPPLETYKVETGKIINNQINNRIFFILMLIHYILTLVCMFIVSFPKSPQELRQTLEASGVSLPLEYSSPVSGSGSVSAFIFVLLNFSVLFTLVFYFDCFLF